MFVFQVFAPGQKNQQESAVKVFTGEQAKLIAQQLRETYSPLHAAMNKQW